MLPDTIAPTRIFRARRLAGLSLVAALVALAACAQPQTPPPDPPASASHTAPAAASSACAAGQAALTVWPQLSSVGPQPVAPRAVVTIAASGGYVQCGAGSINELARSFRLDLDGAPVASLTCYVNHCEGRFVLPARTVAGTHKLAVEGGSELGLDVR